MPIGNISSQPSMEDKFKPYRRYLAIIHKSFIKCLKVGHCSGEVIKWRRK